MPGNHNLTLEGTKTVGLPIDCHKLEKSYGSHKALGGISIKIPAGSCLAVLGPNGAGKTTLFKLVLGLIKPSGGQILVGEHPAGHRLTQPAIGFLPESVAFDRAATGAETLTYLARLKGAPLNSCEKLLSDVGLGHAAQSRISTYSKGMRQRLGLAQALLGRPRLLLLDEPTSGLDPDLRRHFYAIIARLREAGTTIIIASHALSEIEAVADRFAILRAGRLLADGPLDALKASAGLPVRLRVSVPDGDAPSIAARFADRMTVSQVNGRTVEFECDESFKVAAVHEIAGLEPPVGDLEIKTPSLEVLYEYFTRQEAQS